MRRIIFITIILCIFLLTISIFIKPLIIFLAKQQVKKVFIGSTVVIGSCNFNPFQLLTLQDIEIKKEQLYNFKIKEIIIHYNPISIIKREILKFSLRDVLIAINLPQGKMQELTKFLKLTNHGQFLVKSLEISNLSLNLRTRELSLEANLSSELDLINQSINYFNLKVASLESIGMALKDATLKVNRILPIGLFSIRQVKYDKLKLEKIESNVRLEDKILFFDSLSAGILGGKIQGNLSLRLAKDREYSVSLEFMDLNLETFINDFNLNEKLQLSGRLKGVLTLKGNGFNISMLNGDFTAVRPGGLLSIKDDRILENIARNSNQSLEILMESFKDYRYNIGVIKLFLDNTDLILDITLEGDAGRRNLNMRVHDSKFRKEEP